MLSIQNLTIHINDVPILSDVSAECGKGRLLAIIGPNGAGKSTMIRALAGIIKPVSGQIFYDQQRLSEFSPRSRARLVSYLPQDMKYEPGYTVEEFIFLANYPWEGYGERGDIQSRLDEALQTCNIEEFRKRPIQSLSSGERQRVYLAQVVFQNTPVILLDEPTTFLDLKNMLQIESVLQELKLTGKILICVTHDLHAARHFSTQVLALKKGKCFALGDPQDILHAQSIARLFEVNETTLRDRFIW